MTPLLYLLAAAGISVLLVRAGRAAFLLLWRGVDAYLAGEARELRAHRGDITGLAEARQTHSLARRHRALAAARFTFWVALLVVPPFTPWTARIYAACTVFWLLPYVPVRRRSEPTV